MPRLNQAPGARPADAVLEVAADDLLAAVRHVTACLAKRSHALLGLLCLPGQGSQGRLLVALADDGRIARLLAELAGLPGVDRVTRGEAAFPALEAVLPGGLAA